MRAKALALFLGALLAGGAAFAETADVRIAWGTPKKTTRTETRVVELQPLAGKLTV